MPSPLSKLETRLGFTIKDRTILDAALTRQAYINENPTAGNDCMDPLATVGDAVLGAVVATRLYESGIRDKGTLTSEKIRGVNRDRTRAFAEKFQLHEFIRWGKGEEKNKVWEQGSQAFDAAFEALIGAVFLDTRRQGKDGLAAVQVLLEGLKFF